ncbi:MAG: DUF1232 domain-containing protein [Proteobacteria bacterium]|nr:DUF1232 domain-containing protein [Pseudomonadota bacterium]MBU4297483.1 DUF1232 domain-containing protein [Pseudomonadota bacterium]MCG2749253.1 DUF1232 domain-containing protein [Desulfobulbaceae bacterium]
MAAEEKYGFEDEYYDKGFWNKVMAFAKTAGKEVIEKALWLYYAAQNPATPAWARSIIYGALGYFIVPLDAIADFTPFVGYVDDLGVLTAAVVTVAFFINKETKGKAARKLKEWFGH